MKKTSAALAATLTCALGFSVLQSGTAEAVTLKKVSLNKTATSIGTLAAKSCDAGLTAYTVLQGMTSGGGYFYAIFNNPKKDAGGASDAVGATVLTKWHFDADTGKPICDAHMENLPLGHGNDIAYHPDFANAGPTLLIPKGKESVGNSGIALVNADTLAALGSTNIKKHTLSGLCYSSQPAGTAYRYVLRRGKNMYVYKEDLSTHTPLLKSEKKLRALSLPAGTADQGLDCSKDNIYSVRSISGHSNTVNYITQYTWAGTYKKSLTYKSKATLETCVKPCPKKASKRKYEKNSASEEVEGVFHIDGQYYMGINHNSGGDDLLFAIKW